ncbi:MULTISPECIES: hypothetical protein [unclassified Roseofilum]|uniref:hypothetical protein n=1 Tax=unclassified Roseofilum TaxID=2620099 RepID=UPI000E9CE8C6|nr:MULTISPECIES: hypothetical protein [unclassified Roseofilum]HBR00389.1 hypothetical protein [Cyanobacteria bacterium UBA11691]MBP0007124.1 hypothetical protein [Roseofilum sp. Belize Diploria]MBP0014996.1 hypothetical protein [Roseofilum sp. SID3]MBP0024564.1 hypothetical protein [Roseofilum sp. SID2]MBP0032114.1 hypothetical protein [Roseofilum sp. Belize BBD 4]
MNVNWFDDLPAIGKMPVTQAAAKLREIGEEELAIALLAAEDRQPAASTFSGWSLFERPWQHAAHTFGYIAPVPANTKIIPIKSAGNINPDLSLKNARIKITLNCLRVASYPGGDTHQILFDFYTQNQLQNTQEHLHFNSTYRVREGERAAIINYPIFVGLNVGNDGIPFKCYTVNIKNEEDEAAVKFLESDVFKAGLKLSSTVQPAIAPLSAMAVGLTKAIARRRKNVPVQDFYLGLDFGSNPLGARLAEGVYVAVQIPEKERRVWDWSDWVYDAETSQVVNDYDHTELIPHNYIAFGISR